MVTVYLFRTLTWVWLRFRDLPAELGRQDSTPEVIPRDYRGRWEWCLPASSVLFLPRLGERTTAVGLRSRGSLDSWLRWSFTFSLMRESLPFNHVCNRVIHHTCQSQGCNIRPLRSAWVTGRSAPAAQEGPHRRELALRHHDAKRCRPIGSQRDPPHRAMTFGTCAS